MQAFVQQRHCRMPAAELFGTLQDPSACKAHQCHPVGLRHRQRPFSAASICSKRSVGHQQRQACRSGRRSVQCGAQAASVSTLEGTKAALLEALDGTDRGIYGVPAEKRQAILDLIQQLEGHGSTDGITADLQCIVGCWRLLFSTIAITGKRRTKLGLRNFISLGDFTQSIDVESWHASNRVDFAVSGFGFLGGHLQIDATYEVAGPKRVSIEFEKASLEPSQLQELFEQNYDLLLSIFNPAGWLDITYLDERLRVGRDDKSNVFLLERV